MYDDAKSLERAGDSEASRLKLLQAAEKNYAQAQFEYGEILFIGRNVQADHAEAAKYYQLAADQDNADALYRLAFFYLYGYGETVVDEEKSKSLFLKSYEKGNSSAKQYYDEAVEKEERRKHDAEEVQKALAGAAEGDVEAMYNLCQYYFLGAPGLEADSQKGEEYMRRSAEGGHVPAMVMMGNGYHGGYYNMENNDVTALEWYRRAADQGGEAARAAFAKIAQFYENGSGGLEVSIELAKDFYRKSGPYGDWNLDRLEAPEKLQRLTESAAAGDSDAQFKLGRVYDYGQLGASMDEPRAAELFRKAADAGHAEAQYSLGVYYNVRACSLGKEWLEPDKDVAFELARKYFQLSADQGNADAECSLACDFSKLESRCIEYDNYGYSAVVSGLRRSEAADGVALDFKATGDGSNGPLQVALDNIFPIFVERMISSTKPLLIGSVLRAELKLCDAGRTRPTRRLTRRRVATAGRPLLAHLRLPSRR